MKITMVGGGNVGATTVQRLADRELCDELVMVDVVEDMPQGKILDMWASAPLQRFDTKIVGSNSYDAMAGSDIVLITAGIARKPGMSRSDLLDTNAKIVGGIVEEVAKGSPNAMIITITNPLDVMTYLAWQKAGWDRSRVFGMAGVLDSARLRTFVADELNVSVRDVQGMVMGGHGDSMVPLARYTTVSGIPITELLDDATIERLFTRTRKAGGEVVALLKTGSAYYSTSSAIAEMVEAVVKNQNRILPCAAILQGEYGLNDVCAGVPCRVNRSGMAEILKLQLSDEETAQLQASGNAVKEDIARLAV